MVLGKIKMDFEKNYSTTATLLFIDFSKAFGRCPHGIMVKAIDCGIISEFERQLRYFGHTLGKV